jgi:hypothetical protein
MRHARRTSAHSRPPKIWNRRREHVFMEPPDTDRNGAAVAVQGDFLRQQAFHQGALFFANHTVVGVAVPGDRHPYRDS